MTEALKQAITDALTQATTDLTNDTAAKQARIDANNAMQQKIDAITELVQAI